MIDVRSMWTYFIKSVSAFNLKFGGGVGINPETERQKIIGPARATQIRQKD